MALINTLRNKMGKVVVGLIAFSIAAFVGADLIGPNSAILGGSNTDIGEIAGQTVTYQDFLAKQEEMTYNFQLQSRRNPSSAELVSIRNQTWDALIAEIAFEKQFEKLGIAISEDEIIDMVQGDNISQEIKQAFTDPSTGEFSKENVIQFLQSLNDQTPQQRASWYNFESQLAPARLRLKFDGLILNTTYITEEEGQYEYANSAATAEIKYLYVPYFSFNDSTVKATDKELNTYLSENEDQYQREESKSLKYISIKVVPSATDTALVKEEIERLKDQLSSTGNDSTFAVVNSDGTSPFSSFNMDQVPAALQTEDGMVDEGTVVGPTLENGKYVLYKLSSVSEGDTYSAKANHILLKWDDESDASKAATKKEARAILRDLKNGADFAEKARLHGTDGTANSGGDLGWFAEGRMVDAFENAVFDATRVGLLRDVVETQFGYHIIEVTALKTNLAYKVAKVELELYVSDDTRNSFYREAESFALESNDLEAFEANAQAAEYEIKTAGKVGKNDRRITGLSDARAVVSWLYNKGEVGTLSNVFEINDSYVLAVMTGEQEKGAADLEGVRYEVKKKVEDAKKAELIKAQLSALSGSLEDIADAYGEGAKVYNMPALKLSSNSLTSVGLAPEAVGVAFSMENGETTAPFEVPNGVIILEMINKTAPAELADIQTYADQLFRNRNPREAYNVDRTVKELADIKDDRYKFF